MTRRAVGTRSGVRVATVWVVIVLVGEVVLSAALGSVRLGTRSLWIDEGFSAMATSLGIGEVVRIAFHVDSNMPLYLGGLRLWRVFGADEAALRSFSVAAAAASIVAVYFLAARLADRVAGLIAGFALAVAPFGVRYAQEARGYSLVVLLVTAATVCFVMAVETHRTGWWVAYAIVAAAACYAHLAALFVVPAQLVSVSFLDRRRIPARRLLGALVALAVLLVPLAVMVLSATDNEGVGAPRVTTVPGYLSEAAGGRLLFMVLAAGTLGTAVLAGSSFRGRGRSIETWRLALAVSMVVVPVVGLFASAVVTNKNWAPRYLIVVLPFLCVAVALSLRRLDWRLAVVGLVVIGLLSAQRLHALFDAPAKDDWRGAVAYIVREGSPDDAVVTCDATNRPALEYYMLRSPAGARPQPLQPTTPWGNGLHQSPNPDTQAMVSPDAPDRIWVVSRPPGQFRGLCDLPEAAGDRTRAVHRDFGLVTVKRYDR